MPGARPVVGRRVEGRPARGPRGPGGGTRRARQVAAVWPRTGIAAELRLTARSPVRRQVQPAARAGGPAEPQGERGPGHPVAGNLTAGGALAPSDATERRPARRHLDAGRRGGGDPVRAGRGARLAAERAAARAHVGVVDRHPRRAIARRAHERPRVRAVRCRRGARSGARRVEPALRERGRRSLRRSRSCGSITDRKRPLRWVPGSRAPSGGRPCRADGPRR